jgi:hypothetical protein
LGNLIRTDAALNGFEFFRLWRFADANRPPETPPAASAFWGIATIRDRVISGKAKLKAKGVKISKKARAI